MYQRDTMVNCRTYRMFRNFHLRGVLNMTVRDLYLYSKDGQTFILFMKGETKFCFKGNLEYCPTELIDRLVYQFHAIDFNTIEVVLY